MQQSYRYLKGQVWFWEDPIYGRKSGKNIDKNEGGIRYSRYVVIMQNTSAIQDTVLVIPLSSNRRYSNSVEINLSHRNNSTISYARVEKIFPANPAALDRYICTLAPEVMEEITRHLQSLIIDDKCEEVTEFERPEKDDVEEIVDTRTIIDEDELPPRKPVQRKRIIVNVPSERKRSTRSKWDDSTRESFLFDYKNLSTDEMVAKYQIGRSSVYRYHALFMADKRSSPAATEKIEDTSQANQVLTTFSNVITDACKKRDIYGKCDTSLITRELFYNKLNSSLYHALGDFFSFRYDRRGQITVSAEDLTDNQFFVEIYSKFRNMDFISAMRSNVLYETDRSILNDDKFQSILTSHLTHKCSLETRQAENVVIPELEVIADGKLTEVSVCCIG